MFQQAIKIQKTSWVHLIIYHQYPNESKWYLHGHFCFHWLEVQQVGEVLEKINNEIAKSRVILIDSKTFHEI